MDDQRSGALAAELQRALASGELEAMLTAARRFHMRNPGHDDATRVVEALELLMSQVWLAPESGEEAYAEAGVFLNACRLDNALGIYRAQIGRAGDTGRAERLARCVWLVMAAAAGGELPRPDPPPAEIELSLSLSELEVVSFKKPREAPPVADEDEPTLDADAFAYDDVTNPAKLNIPAEAYRDEPTMQLEVGDYQLEALVVAPPSQETTRVAQPGELPLDELRALMESEGSDSALDGLLDELADEVDPATTEVSHVELIAHPPMEEPAREARSFGSSPAIPSVAELAAVPGQAPLATREVALPAAGSHVQEPSPAGKPASGEITGGLDQSWTGVRLHDTDTTFEPGVESLSDDQWEVADGEPEKGSPAEAEAMVQRGELGEALRVYQELAARAPDDVRLWARVAEIAKLLQRESEPR